MPRQTLYLWKQAPFLRLVTPLMAGIVLQWYAAPAVWLAWTAFILCIAGVVFFNLRISFRQYRFGWINGLFINTCLLALGMLLVWYRDAGHQQGFLNTHYQDKDIVTVVLQEGLSEKTNSFKANAAVLQLLRGDSIYPVSGNIIVYFKKDSSLRQLGYGSQLVLQKSLQPIKNSGNPGAFDYERYTHFQGIGRQVYLLPGEYIVLPEKKEKWLQHGLLATREKVLQIIRTYIPGEKEAGLAEALLLGYKDDLDKTLVQSYSNTGVVHVIAISGMHLALIYWLLSLLLHPLKKRKAVKWLSPLLTIAGLWLFAFLTGGGPSILRSAVMFSCIVLGESLERKTFIYNSLAASAFILLCINPFWLWDAGFQLSYTAVLSIVVFMKPIYNCLYFENKMVDAVWKLMAVTLAAQVLTTPVSIYHFHQFPVYFLLTNLLAVPLSGIIILLELFLCACAFIPALAHTVGVVLQQLIFLMNSFIEHVENLPFSLWDSLQINMPQLIVLYGFIAAMAYWLMRKSRIALICSLACLLCFLSIRSWSFIRARQQQQLIVYNLPKHQAIDFISGRSYFFKSDSSVYADDYLQNFHLKPSRIQHRMNIAPLQYAGPALIFNNRKIVLVDTAFADTDIPEKITADLLILSKNAPAKLAQLLQAFNCRQLVFDASCPFYKVNKWKAEAAKLGLHCFSVVDNGAFVMNMD